MTNKRRLPKVAPLLSPAAAIVQPSQRVLLYSAGEWEEFMREWMEGFDPAYTLIERLGGPGDFGRDVVGYVDGLNSGGPWDNYQCKHYAQPLRPVDIWPELGKLCFYTHRGDFPPPRHYRFVAPRGVGIKVHDLLRKPQQLARKLLELWPSSCEDILGPMTPALQRHIETFDFSSVGYIPLADIVAQHRRTTYHFQRFGIELPARPPADTPPLEAAAIESLYLKCLLEAYSDHLSQTVTSVDDTVLPERLKRHFARSREHFYEAETLNRFSRDHVEADAFDRLKEEFFDGVINTVETDHADGYARVVAATDKAQQLHPTSNVLSAYLTVGDKHGVCHHLANDGKLEWVEHEE